MISFRGHAQQWHIFRMASDSQMKWKSWAIALVINRNTAWFSKSECFDRTQTGEFMNERVKDLSQRCCYVSTRFFKWVYGNPWPLLVGICRIPAYHRLHTTAHGLWLITINRKFKILGFTCKCVEIKKCMPN